MDLQQLRNFRPAKKQCYMCFKKFDAWTACQKRCCSDECQMLLTKIRKKQQELDKLEKEQKE